MHGEVCGGQMMTLATIPRVPCVLRQSFILLELHSSITG